MSDSNTEGQNRALEKASRFIGTDDPIFRVSGSAGTGKTYLTTQVCSWLDPEEFVGVATTHKAVGCLSDRLPDAKTMTAFKFLGLKPVKNRKPGEQQRLERTRSYDASEYAGVNVVALDEGSLANTVLKDYILRDIRDWGRKYIIIGDNYQLPPVGELTSPLFDLDLPEHLQEELTEPQRFAKGNPIIKLATSIRDDMINFRDPKVFSANEGGKGVFLLKPKDWEGRYKEFCEEPEFLENPDFCRAIAYRNMTVAKLIQSARENLGRNMDTPFSVGDFLVANEAYVNGDEVIFNTGQEFEVLKIKEHAHEVYPELRGYEVELKGYEFLPIKVLDHVRSGVAFKLVVEKAIDTGRKNNDWSAYYGLMEYYADLRLPYSITAHKSQGSTFKHSFVDLKDIYTNKSSFEADRCLYVAVTRASESVYIKW
jgi:hypothetical protein